MFETIFLEKRSIYQNKFLEKKIKKLSPSVKKTPRLRKRNKDQIIQVLIGYHDCEKLEVR